MRMLKKFTSFLMASAMLLGFACSVYADDMPVTQTRTTGTVRIEYFDDADETQPISGAEFTLYRVAKLSQNSGGNNLDASYESVIPEIVFDSTGSTKKETDEKHRRIVTLETQPSKYLKQVQYYYEDRTDGKYQNETNAMGHIEFKKIPAGVYVCAETGAADGHYVSEPCLVILPSTANDEDGNSSWQYTQTVCPKSVPTGGLTVQKILSGDNVETDRQFTFAVDIDAGDGKYQSLAFPYQTSDGRNGKIKDGEDILLKGGQTATISMLPVGTAYSVTEKEANTDGYTTEVKDGEGHIIAHKTNISVIINTRNTEKNKIGASVPTGDFVMYGTVVALAACIIILVVAIVSEKKKNRENKKDDNK